MEFESIIGYIIAALSGGGVSGGIVFWRLNKRMKEAEVKNQEAQTKNQEIENINDIVEKVYKPMIDSLRERVEALDAEVKQLREERKEIAKRHEEEMDLLKKDCVTKSEYLRKQIVDLTIELGKKADRQARAKNGQYTKMER